MKIAMVASEINPLAKSGGLADVVYSLSKELLKAKQDVICVMPFYSSVKKKIGDDCLFVGEYPVYLSWRRGVSRVFLHVREGIKYYLIQNRQYFERDNLYGYDDDGERFAFFAQAARGLFEFISFKPDIIHVHDWQSAIIPTLVKEQNKFDPFFKGTKFVLTIHNPAFQGMLDKEALGDLFNLPLELFDNGKCRFNGRVSTLKSGMVYADKITTVSPEHRNELLRRPSSWGFDGVLKLREDDFIGIVNGIDVDEFNPFKDGKISKNYHAGSFISGKKANKDALFDSLGLDKKASPTF